MCPHIVHHGEQNVTLTFKVKVKVKLQMPFSHSISPRVGHLGIGQWTRSPVQQLNHDISQTVGQGK